MHDVELRGSSIVLSSKYFYIIIFGGKMLGGKIFKVSGDGVTGFQNAAQLLVSTDYSE